MGLAIVLLLSPCRGGPGDDYILGDEGDDISHGRSHDDILDGGAESDRIYGELGDDVIYCGFTGTTNDDYGSGGAGERHQPREPVRDLVQLIRATLAKSDSTASSR